MLVKKELLTIPTLPKPQGKWRHEYVPAAQIVELPKSGRILAVDFYTGKKVFTRFFCDGRNYTVYDVKKGVWRNGYPTPDCSGYYCPDIERVNETDAVCNSFFPGEHRGWRTGVEEVYDFIYQKGSEKRERARDNLNALMKRHMDMFPAYPDNLKEYCSEQGFQKSYIFVSAKDKKGVRTALCSHCGAEFTINTSVVSGKETTCPVCGDRATYRAAWIKSDVVDRADICICHKVDNQLLIRWAHVERTYSWPDFKQRYCFDDFAYSLYTAANSQQRIYTYKYFQSPYAYAEQWHRLPLDSTCDSSSYVYTDNLNEVFGERYYNVNLKAGLAGKRLKLQFVHLLDNLKTSGKAEYLFKLGLPMLAASATSIRGNPDGQGTFQQQVGISKQYLPMLREMNVTAYEVRTIREAGEWVSPELLQRYRDFKADNIGALSELIQTVGLSKMLNYIEKQRKLHPKMSIRRLAVDYRDYISMSRDLGVDLGHKSVRFPEDIVEAHRTLTGRYNAVENEIKMRKAEALDQDFHDRANQLYEELGLSEFRKGEFCVVLPQKRTELIAEGQSLNHCVGGDRYYKSHMEGRDMIFFIRKAAEPDKPYFTMEMDVVTGRILQLYGFGDCSAPKEVKAFANAFSQFMHNKKARKSA